MSDRLSGKVAVVTGSTSGIGAVIAQVMAAEGAAVVVSGRRAEQGEAVVNGILEAGGNAVFHQADLSTTSECALLCDRAHREFGGLDILVNNAGIFPEASFEDTTPELWDEVMGLNAKAAFFCAQAAVPFMKTRDGGSIINVGSTHPFGAGGNQFVYGVSKGTMLTLTRKLAMLLAKDKIRVNWISVGWVLSEQERALRNVPEDDAEWIARHQEYIPMREFTTSEDVAASCLYLAADSGRHVTGTDIGVNSGISIHM
ncbi:MAG: glucose 1-dehydrogenase [Spirochaetales bacterium]|nr:MAG: glucose 1-dehydrogenase [Spirochaetales bacterium]